MLEKGDPPEEGAFSINPDGSGGHFLMRHLRPLFEHRPAPESERITVSGTWRCPATK
jgi:hypothetical protein